MVFRTIIDDITGANKSIGLFGLSLQNVSDRLYEIQTRGFKDTLFNTSIIDVSALEQYNLLLERNYDAQKALEIVSKGTNKATIALLESANGATISTEQMTAAQEASTVAARAQSAAYKAVSVAGNMIAFTLIAKGIQVATDAIDHYVNRAEYAAEAMKEAQQKIDDAQSTLKTMSDTLSENKDRFLELSQGVDKFSNNLSLSEEDYVEYLSISNQLAELFPSLVSGYDDQGNALLAIGSNANETNEKLQSLLETQQAVAQQTLIDNMDDVANGIYYEVKDAKDSISDMESELSSLQQQYKDLNIDIINSDGLISFSDEDYSKYGKAMEEALTSAGVEFEKNASAGLYETAIQLISASPQQLEAAQKFYDAWLESENEYYHASENGLKQDIQEKENTIEASYTKMTANLQAWLQDNYNYQYLSDSSSAMIDALVPEIKWDELEEPPMTAYDYQNYVEENIIKPLMEVPKEHKQEIDNMFQQLLSFEEGDLDVLDFAKQLQKKLDAYGIEIDITPIIANEQEAKDRLQNSIESIAEGGNSDFTTSSGTKVDADDYKKLQDYTKDFDIKQIELWNDATLGANNAADAIKKYEEALNSIPENSDETSILSEAKLEELREQADQLSSIINEIQSSYDTLQSAIEEYNEQGYLSLDTLNSLLSLDDEYLACLVNENGQLSLNADAMNALAQSKLNEAEASAVAEAMTELYAIANGEVASSTANYISGNANLMQSLALLAGQYDNVANAAMTAAQAQKLSAMIEAANAKDSAATARVMSGLNSRLGLIHSTASSIKTRNVGGISNKKSSGSGSASSVDTWKDKFQAQYDLLKHNLEMEYITEEQYYGALNALNEKYFANNAKYTDEYRKYQEEVYKGLQKVYKEYIENQMSYLEKALAANKISFSHYSSAVKTMLDDMWKDGKISAEDYWSYVEKMLKQQLDIYDSVINAVTNLLDKEIDKIQNEIDALEDKNDALNKQLDQYDGILAIVDDVYDAEIERIREQQDAIDDTIDKLQKENDEKQRGIELEKARYQLYKSLNQRNVKLFNGQEFVYTTNRDEVREAQQNLADLEFDQTIDALEKERDALDAEIEKLEEFKEKWADITEEYDNEINKQLATALWGKDYESIILSNRISDIENFKDEYTSIQAQIDDNQSMIDSYNEKIEYYEYLKEQWSDISKVYDEERDKLYASQILGAQWEKDILSGRLDFLNNFKEQYVLLQQQMAEAAVNSANAIIEANNRINSSTTSVPSSPFSGGSSGGGGTSTPAPAPVDPHPDKYWVYKTLGTYSTSGEASSKIGMLGGDQVIKVGSKYLVVKWKKGYTTQGEASSHISFLGGNGVYKRYAKGTINARKGLHLVSEDKYGDEIILRNNGTAVVAKGEQFYPFEGGETVINASDTKKLLANMDNLVPLHDSANPFARLKLQPIDSNAMVMNHLNLPNYNNLLPVNRDSSTTISIGDIHLHEVQNANTLANSIIRELPGKVIQRLGK